MTYPLSSDVVAGQPTAADHYNNLRADALRLGQSYADSANLGDLLTRFDQNLTIQILGTDRLRVPCSVSVPVSLVVDNYYILKSTSNIDLPAGGKPSGSAMLWYVFAVRTPGSTIFSLMVNTSPAEYATVRLIGSFYWNGSAIESASIHTSKADSLAQSINHVQSVVCNGRLSMYSAGAGFADFDQSPQLFLNPYKGNQISLFVPGWGWVNHTLPSVSPPTLYFAGLNTGKCYDVFAYWDGAAVQLEGLAWSNLTARATSIVNQDGVWLKSTDLSRLYMGTFLPYSASAVSDSKNERGLWNFFNRVARQVLVTVATASWTYSTPGTWRSPNGSDAMVRVVIGLLEDFSRFELHCIAGGGASLYGMVGIGDNSNSVNSANLMTMSGGVASMRTPTQAIYNTLLGVGAHSIYWLEGTSGAGAVTFNGSPVASFTQSGLTGTVFC